MTPKDPECVDDKKVSKPKMSAGESIKFLSGSAYIRDLATLVVAYGISINLVEVIHYKTLQRKRCLPSDTLVYSCPLPHIFSYLTPFMLPGYLEE